MNIAITWSCFYTGYLENMPDDFVYLINPSYAREHIEDADIVIFSGGEDINPAIYGQKVLASSFSPKRDEIEIQYWNIARELNKPIIGICRGHQLINALLGGELVQDINYFLKENHSVYHGLNYLEDSIFNDINPVNSFHHQGVIKLGDGLTGISMYRKVWEMALGKNIITAQFHPEAMNTNFFELAKTYFEKGE